MPLAIMNLFLLSFIPFVIEHLFATPRQPRAGGNRTGRHTGPGRAIEHFPVKSFQPVHSDTSSSGYCVPHYF